MAAGDHIRGPRAQDKAYAHTRQLPALTGVRALAAFLVFFHHHPSTRLQIGPLNLWREMHIGVTLFFVLSGLVITWRYDRTSDDRIQSLPTYFLNRFARIYPVFFLVVIPTLLIQGERSPLVWFLNLSLIKGFSDAYKFAGLGLSWSLTVEECFYATAPVLFLLWRRGPGIALAAAAAILAVLLPLSTLPAVAAVFGPPRFVLLYTYFGRFFEFFVGVWLAKRLARAPVEPAPGAMPWFTLAGGAGIVAVLFALAALGGAPGPMSYGLYRPAGIVLNNFVLPLFIGSFYWGLVREKSFLRAVLATRFADLLGRSSYAFYLIHYGPLLVFLSGLLVTAAGYLGPGAAAAAGGLLGHTLGLFLFVTALSVLLYAGFEKPANLAIRRWGARGKAPARRPNRPAETGEAAAAPGSNNI